MYLLVQTEKLRCFQNLCIIPQKTTLKTQTISEEKENANKQYFYVYIFTPLQAQAIS